MSFWQPGFWAAGFWQTGFWQEGAAPPDFAGPWVWAVFESRDRAGQFVSRGAQVLLVSPEVRR